MDRIHGLSSPIPIMRHRHKIGTLVRGPLHRNEVADIHLLDQVPDAPPVPQAVRNFQGAALGVPDAPVLLAEPADEELPVGLRVLAFLIPHSTEALDDARVDFWEEWQTLPDQ